jgi:DnaJ like chaperone protein
MSLWTRIADALSALSAGEPLTAVFERLRTPPERSVAFAIAVIGLGAKMAKADGQVTRDEVTAFREVFFIPERPRRRTRRACSTSPGRTLPGSRTTPAASRACSAQGNPALCDLMEGLFHIALADGQLSPGRGRFPFARCFDLRDRPAQLPVGSATRFVADAVPDPWDVLGIRARHAPRRGPRRLARAGARDAIPTV